MYDGILLCDDLIFTSRITGVASALGFTIRSTKTAADVLHFMRQTPVRCVILDLQTPGLVVEDVVAAATAQASKPWVIGYGSHVDAATLKKARDAGCDVVWPRSKFVEELATALPRWLASRKSAPPQQDGAPG